MREVRLPDGTAVAALGQGTWQMGEDGSRRGLEVRALRRGLELGMTLIDTAEMYADGGAEEVVAEALAGARERAFLVSKVYPHNAGAGAIARACEASLRRLRVERLDLYLLHWRGAVPLAETVAGMERLVALGKIARWGVSNFDVSDMEELWAVPGGDACAVNQILYNPSRRGPELGVMPWCEARGVPIMAYSPVEQGRLPEGGALAEVAAKHGVHAYAVALAWLLDRPGVIAIPKAGSAGHVEANAKAVGLALDEADRQALEAAFPRPTRRRPLEML